MEYNSIKYVYFDFVSHKLRFVIITSFLGKQTMVLMFYHDFFSSKNFIFFKILSRTEYLTNLSVIIFSEN